MRHFKSKVPKWLHYYWLAGALSGDPWQGKLGPLIWPLETEAGAQLGVPKQIPVSSLSVGMACNLFTACCLIDKHGASKKQGTDSRLETPSRSIKWFSLPATKHYQFNCILVAYVRLGASITA
jgi:hypothetical protein